MSQHRVVGANAALPPSGKRELLDAVLALPGVGGLEISWGSPSWAQDRGPTSDAVDAAAARVGGVGIAGTAGGAGAAGAAAVVEGADLAATSTNPYLDKDAQAARSGPAHLAHLVTLVGLQVGLAAEHGAGLAATDDDARRRAVEAIAAAREEIVTWVAGGRQVVGVELHSFPGTAPERAEAAGEALRRSLAEIASWDWAGAELLVEHCDARVGETWAKGLLPLTVELAAVQDVVAAAPRTPVGIALNTGRSAIEGRSARTAVAHARLVQASGLLRGVVVSGAPARSGPFGAAWSDTHPPLVESCAESAIGATDVAEVLLAAGPLLVDGAKVAAPSSFSPDERLGLIRATLAALAG